VVWTLFFFAVRLTTSIFGTLFDRLSVSIVHRRCCVCRADTSCYAWLDLSPGMQVSWSWAFLGTLHWRCCGFVYNTSPARRFWVSRWSATLDRLHAARRPHRVSFVAICSRSYSPCFDLGYGLIFETSVVFFFRLLGIVTFRRRLFFVVLCGLVILAALFGPAPWTPFVAPGSSTPDFLLACVFSAWGVLWPGGLSWKSL